MTVVAPLTSKQYRLAQYYLNKLSSANRAYQLGDENTLYGVKVAQQDWSQIQHWQAWSSVQAAHQREAAELCCAYPQAAGDLLDLMLPVLEQRAWYEAALGQARQLHDQRSEREYLLELSSICIELAEFEQARAYNQTALDYAQQTDDKTGIARSFTIMGDIAFSQGILEEALNAYQNAFQLWHELGQRIRIASLLRRLSLVASARQNYTEARRYAEDSLQIFRELGSRSGILGALEALIDALFEVESPENLRHYIEEGLQIARQSALRWRITSMLNLLCQVMQRQGEYDAALTVGEEALKLDREMGSKRAIAFQGVIVGTVQINREHYAAARAHFEESLQLARQIGTPFLIAIALFYRSFEASLTGNYTQARGYAEDHAKIEVERGMIDPQLDNHFLAAYACTGLHEFGRARRCLLTALQVIQSKNLSRYGAPFIVLAAFLHLHLGDGERGALLLGVCQSRVTDIPWEARPTFRAVRASCRAALDAETFVAAFERGRDLDFDTIVTELIVEFMA